MVVGLIVYGSIDTVTGGYLYDKHLVQTLQKCGHRVHLLPLPMRSYLLRCGQNLANGHLKSVCDARLDLLMQDELCHPSLFGYNRRLRRRSRVPVVSIVHHLVSNEPRSKWRNRLLAIVERHYLDTVDGFVFNSQTTRDMVFQLSSERRPHVVAPPGGDRMAARITEAEIIGRAMQPGPLRLLFMGLVIRRKGLSPLIEALRRADPSCWRLDVIGDLTMEPKTVTETKNRLRHAGLSANVCFWGSVSDEVLTAKLAEAHLLCMPFAYEGFGIATLEAMAFGVPALASGRGGSGEIIEPGVSGELFAPGDLQAVTDALNRLQADRNRLAAMSVSAYRRSKRHPGWQASMQRVEEFLSQMAQPSGLPKE